MTKSAVLLTAFCCVACMACSSAMAGFAPRMSASSTLDGTTILSYSQAASDDAAAALVFFVPSDYISNPGQAEGENVGSATAAGRASDTGASLSLSGSITGASAATPINYAGQDVTLGAAATTCTGSATHGAYWVANLAGAGQSIQIPIYIDQLFGSDPLATIGSYSIRLCLPPPGPPVGTPGRAPAGLQLTQLNFAVNSVWSVFPGWYVWRLLATPYVAGSAQLNTAGAVEVQAVDRFGQVLTLTSKPLGHQTVRIAGKLSAGSRGVPHAKVVIHEGTKVLGSATTDSGGHFAAPLKLTARTVVLTATSQVPAASAGKCPLGAAFPPAPCIGAYVFGFTVSSKATRVRR